MNKREYQDGLRARLLAHDRAMSAHKPTGCKHHDCECCFGSRFTVEGFSCIHDFDCYCDACIDRRLLKEVRL